MSDYRDGIEYCGFEVRRADCFYGPESDEAIRARVELERAHAWEPERVKEIECWLGWHLVDFTSGEGRIDRSGLFGACVRALGLGHEWERRAVILAIRGWVHEGQIQASLARTGGQS